MTLGLPIAERAAFLARAGLASADLVALTQDASARRYYRAASKPGVLVMELGQAPGGPDAGAQIVAIEKMTAWLAGIGLCVPQIYDADAGLMLIEDLGDTLFARAIADDPALEARLYSAAVDCLGAILTATPPRDLPLYDRDFLEFELAICTDWYAPNTEALPALTAAFVDAFDRIAPLAEVVVLRDFHAENLFWLPGRKGVQQVGLIDFQDARLGHAGYDVASLLGDARRDVTPALWSPLVAQLARAIGQTPEDLDFAARVLSAQRNLKILGIFARLTIRDGRKGYLDLLGRVWRNLHADLTTPGLAAIADVVARHIPPLDAAQLARIGERAAT